MNANPDRLYDLVPVVYRLRDADQGYPLRALLRIMNEQYDILEQDIAKLYDNWFIETCDDWIVPYIGELIGYELLSGPVATQTAAGIAISAPRREVGDTIGYRRRKGTLSAVEDVARAVSGWPLKAVEFYRHLAVNQNVNCLNMSRGRTGELRDADALDRLDGPFDEMARNVDVRRLNSTHARGQGSIPELGVFVWRLKILHADKCSGVLLRSAGAEQLPVQPAWLRYAALHQSAVQHGGERARPRPSHSDPPPLFRDPRCARFRRQGPVRRSVLLRRGPEPDDLDRARPEPGDRRPDRAGGSERLELPPSGDQVAVDPQRGRIMVPPGQTRRYGVWVSYSYGFQRRHAAEENTSGRSGNRPAPSCTRWARA